MFRNYWGYEIEMMNNMAKKFNFTYKIENPPDAMWGQIEPDGRWNGMIHYTSINEMDMAIGDIMISYGRHQVELSPRQCIQSTLDNASFDSLRVQISQLLDRIVTLKNP